MPPTHDIPNLPGSRTNRLHSEMETVGYLHSRPTKISKIEQYSG